MLDRQCGLVYDILKIEGIVARAATPSDVQLDCIETQAGQFSQIGACPRYIGY